MVTRINHGNSLTPLPWTALLYGLAITCDSVASSVTTSRSIAAPPSGRISGHGFFDSSDESERDTATGTLEHENGIGGIRLYLFTCAAVMPFKTTKTDDDGFYAFENLGAGLHYISVPSVPSRYVFSDIWNGEVDGANGHLAHAHADITIDPARGRTECFDLAEGGARDVSFWLKLNAPSAATLQPIIAVTASSTSWLTSGVTPPPTNVASSSSTVYTFPASLPSKAPAVKPKLTVTPFSTKGLSFSSTNEWLTFSPRNEDPSKLPTVETADPITLTRHPTKTAEIPAPISIPVRPIPNLVSVLVTSDPTETPSHQPTVSMPVSISTPEAKSLASGSTVISFTHSNSSPVAPTPTSGVPFADLPTSSPQNGSTETGHFVMNIHGIERLDDEVGWSERTADYVMQYFNANVAQGMGVFDVSVDIVVTKQTSSGQSIFERLRLLQSVKSNVKVAYDQRSSYRTLDSDKFDGFYVAARPFQTTEGAEGYVATLRDLSPHYDDITNIDSVEVADRTPSGAGTSLPGASIEGKEDDHNESDGPSVYIIAGLVGGAVVVAALVIGIHQRTGRRKGFMEPVGNGPQSSTGQRVYGNLDDGALATSPPAPSSRRPSSNVQGRISPNDIIGQNRVDDLSFASISLNSSMSEVVVQVIAPAGRLGVVVDTRPEGGPSYVRVVEPSSPVTGRIRPGDKVLAVDNDDVQRMSAVGVADLLRGRSSNRWRKITMLREVDRLSSFSREDSNRGDTVSS